MKVAKIIVIPNSLAMSFINNNTELAIIGSKLATGSSASKRVGFFIIALAIPTLCGSKFTRKQINPCICFFNQTNSINDHSRADSLCSLLNRYNRDKNLLQLLKMPDSTLFMEDKLLTKLNSWKTMLVFFLNTSLF